ncbi:hypothetical protein AB0937_02735 [Streptomyces sp. NPDC047880]|uniref:hypothetical protein n=1 Tax=Streptomyces sp. NPDC047880 TaxID=3155626 RepID=UPI003454B26C
MNALKTVAVVAGTVIAAGAAAPAYANEADAAASVDLSTVTETVDERTGDGAPLQQKAEKLGLTKEGRVGKTLKNSTHRLSNSGSLLGGLPVNR